MDLRLDFALYQPLPRQQHMIDYCLRDANFSKNKIMRNLYSCTLQWLMVNVSAMKESAAPINQNKTWATQLNNILWLHNIYLDWNKLKTRQQ